MLLHPNSLSDPASSLKHWRPFLPFILDRTFCWFRTVRALWELDQSVFDSWSASLLELATSTIQIESFIIQLIWYQHTEVEKTSIELILFVSNSFFIFDIRRTIQWNIIFEIFGFRIFLSCLGSFWVLIGHLTRREADFQDRKIRTVWLDIFILHSLSYLLICEYFQSKQAQKKLLLIQGQFWSLDMMCKQANNFLTSGRSAR